MTGTHSRLRDAVKAMLPQPMRTLFRRLVPYRTTARTIRERWMQPDVKRWPPKAAAGANTIEPYEYSLFSQNGEDGIIRFLFQEMGFRSRRFLEFGFGPTQANSLRLMLKEGLGGVFIDANEKHVNRLNREVGRLGMQNVKAVPRFLDVENLDGTIRDAGLSGEIDMLSIDVDGNDYWFWETIEVVRPRLVVIEYNASLGPHVSLSVPYDPAFDRHQEHPSGFYCGASIQALERLGLRKGYRLVGCDSNGVNAFFVEKNSGGDRVPTVSAEAAFRVQTDRVRQGYGQDEQYAVIKDMPYVEIS